MKQLKNYSRYFVDADGMAVNRHTENAIKLEGHGDKKYYRLTDDQGNRKQVYLSEILKEINEPVELKVEKDESPKMKIGCFVLSQRRHSKLIADLEAHKHSEFLKEVQNRNFAERGVKADSIKQLLGMNVEEPLICLVCEIGAGTVYNYRKKLERGSN
jgi:hypothetical protein